MPELPEVQTIINHLSNQSVLNHKIISIDVLKPKILKNCSVEKFTNFMINESIKEIERNGKFLIFKLTNKKILVIHLRMEGKLFYLSNDEAETKHLMVRIFFNNKHKLLYDDSRMFGTFNIYDSYESCLNSKELSKVAIDPLNNKFDGYYVQKVFKNCSKAIKTALLDQTKISGIGNIYADEILFASKIHPLTKAKDLTLQEYKDIATNARKILNLAIEHKGTTIFSYKFDPSHSGEFQSMLKVHTHNNEPCPSCKTKIEKIKVNGRGTYYCPKCQKRK